MKYYTFAPEFIDAIRAGQKVSTIRSKAKVRVGETFGLRRAEPRTLLRWQQEQIGTARFLWMINIRIEATGRRVGCVWSDTGEVVTRAGCEAIAKYEGFASWIAMWNWFMDRYYLPYEGIWMYWGNTFEEVESWQ